MKIVWQSFEGHYSDSTRVLFERWRQDRPADEHVWLADCPHRSAFPADVPHRADLRPGQCRGAGGRRPRRGEHPHRRRVAQATRRPLRPDLARHPAQADPPRRAVGAAGPPRPAAARRRPLGSAAVTQLGEHAAAARRLPLSRRGARDGLPAQRRPEQPRQRRSGGAAPARSTASPTTRWRCSTCRPGATTSCSADEAPIALELDSGVLLKQLGPGHRLLVRAHPLVGDRLTTLGGDDVAGRLATIRIPPTCTSPPTS